MSALSPSLAIEDGQIQKAFRLQGEDWPQETQGIEMTANMAASAEDIFAVLNQWYAAKKRKLVVHPNLEEKIRRNNTLLYYVTAGKGQAAGIVAISFLYRLEESDLKFYFNNTGLQRPALPVWHRAITETDADFKGYGLGTYLLELTIKELGENNYLHAFVEYQGKHPQGQQRWEASYRGLGFKKVAIVETDFTFFVREPDILEKKNISADICVSYNNTAMLSAQMNTTQGIAQSI